MKHVKGLDTLRALAVIFVIIEHWLLPIDIGKNKAVWYWIKGILPDGGFGLVLFFVLSGFLITNVLLDALKNSNKGKWEIIKNFIARRILRIFPIYYLTIFLLIISGYPFVKDHIWWFLLYISNILIYKTQVWNEFSHTWTLAVEEQFYLIWPLFIIFIRGKYLKFVFIASVAIGLVITGYTMNIKNNWAGFVLMPACIPAFGIGGGYAFLRRTESTAKFLKILNAVLPIALFFHFYWAFTPNSSHQYSFLFLTVNSIISIWLIDKAINVKSVFAKKYIFENRILLKIGQISYGIYLFHYPLTYYYDRIIKKVFNQNIEIESFLSDWRNSYFIRILLLFLIALISFHLVEKPILKLKRYFK